MTNAEQIKATFLELCTLVQLLEKDLDKSLSKGNASAGRRTRAGLRDVKKKCTDLIKQLVEANKEAK
jgi:hypothetical protein